MTPMPETRIITGGSMAPPLDAAKITEYRKLAEGAPDQVKEGMTTLLAMADSYAKGPAAKAAGTKAGTAHASGMGNVVPLEDAEVKRLWDVVPWNEELEMYGKIFERIDPSSSKKLRDAAFHLLWLGRELFLDREPRFMPPK
jgi:hypothetical protein